VVEDFLRWSSDSANRRGSHPLTISRLNTERDQLRAIIQSLCIGGRSANRIQPLEEEQIKAIRLAIGPTGTSQPTGASLKYLLLTVDYGTVLCLN
jgi:hypothetical protein